MINYVAGFCFSTDSKYVALIRKNRPKWQAGKLNGIGGHVELTDTNPRETMVREFKEETGLAIPYNKWENFVILIGKVIVFISTVHGQKIFRK